MVICWVSVCFVRVCIPDWPTPINTHNIGSNPTDDAKPRAPAPAPVINPPAVAPTKEAGVGSGW